MRKLAKIKFVNIFLTAILILSQAVFLFIPVLTGQAQTDSGDSYGAYNTTTPHSTTYTNPTSDATADTNNTTSDGSNIIFQDIITDNNDSATHYLLTMEFVSPPARVSGQSDIFVKLSEEAEVIFYIYKDGAEINKYPATYKGDKIYFFSWETKSLADGQYSIKAYAKKSDYVDISRQINITIDNSSSLNSSPTPTIINNNFTDIKTTDSTLPYEIIFLEAFQPPISGDRRITVSLNKDVDRVDFSVEGPRSDKYSGVRDSSRQYYFMWNTPGFPNGYYKVAANAWAGGTVKTSRSFGIQIANNGTSPNNTLQPTQPQTGEMMEKQPLNMMPQAQPELLPECKENNISSIEECQRFMNIAPDCRSRGLLSQEECNKFMSIPPECRDKGLLSMEECNKYMSIPPQCREKGILDKEECTKYSYRYSMPIECQKAGVTAPEECNNIIFLNSMPSECRKANVKSRGDCEKLVKIQVLLSPECQKAKITDQAACDKYMAKNFMAPECKDAGVATTEECNYILREKVSNLNVRVKIEVKTDQGTEFMEVGLPEECRQAGVSSAEECEKIMFLKQAPEECQKANITDPDECKKHMQLANMPEECRAAGVSDRDGCEKIMFEKNAPKECLDAKISTPEECEKYMFKKSAPTDCQEAGILTPEACKKYMFEKYNGAENIPADKFPIECQKAGAGTADDCEKVMQKMYLPKECQSQGITDEAKCETYMQQKNMPKECQAAGAKTRSECDKIMFKKYGPKECLAAGIEDEVKCEDFMFSKYAPKVTCQGIDDWQCKNSIKERHLGNIVAKQVQYKELEEKVSYLAGNSITQEKLNASLDVAREMIPLKEGKAGFRILNTEGKMTLDDGDNLVQTAPIALMVDSDQDGLPDDMEKRLGTDLSKTDTDGDGYTDGAEVKNNYNPSGEGSLGNVLSPVEEAIIDNKILGQPKSEGEVSESFTVASVDNILDEKNLNKGYTLEGTAEADSTITLYLYSDLPLVATVKADEYGNWQYEFNESLIEGEHEVYVALNDNTGKIIAKSDPLSFFIREAKAASVEDFISETVAPINPESGTGNLIKYYIIIAALIVIVGVLLFVVFFIQKRRQT
ncbi:MAG: Ig-like domain-containing protein [Patescibacteria group bacterium]|nr:Ig-like domain-containing protein [Patescibacteria group bacterium]